MNANEPVGASRFRLRFLLQEFELTPGDTLIGRSDECQITIFDPLISRKHARIDVNDDRALLIDLGSRNGCRVNGVPIREPYTLKEGDRVRIGKHELVFSEIAAVAAGARFRQTGSLVFCGSCDTAYAGEMGMCPSCGSEHALNEETRSGVFDERGKEVWAIDMLLELFARAAVSQREQDAERVMRQIKEAIENQVKAGSTIEAARLDPVASAAAELSKLQGSGFWISWAADLYERVGLTVPGFAAEEIARWDSSDSPTREAQPTNLTGRLPG